jgi:RNA polymerase sigma-70 factor (ECF subfamily)
MTSWHRRLEQLFSVHGRRLESLVARRVKDRETAAEIVQDVFCRVLGAGSHGTLDADTKVLYASARNAAIEHGRMEGRRRRILGALRPEQLACEPLAPDAVASGRAALKALEEALAELSPRCREIFILHRVENLPNAEIARRYAISVSAVEKHIARALRHCQARLADHLDPR